MQSEPAIPFKLKLDIATGSTRAGEPVVVTVRFENHEAASVALERTSEWFEYELKLTGPDGREVIRTRFGNQQYRAPLGQPSTRLMVEPGASTTTSLLLSRIFDMTISGEYRLIASRELRSPIDNEWVHVGSDALQIMLHE